MRQKKRGKEEKQDQTTEFQTNSLVKEASKALIFELLFCPKCAAESYKSN